ncbi:MAG TPA: tryptophan-rich sensory protein [Methanothrix sp.]|nr:TspO/MBR family protein [Methanothrix sp.]HOK58140.1 tryptophan-rich sensory protein [Methanothrix sp.]HOL43044.1 tryptophan-rich sensory protein [Methanothrix sp.]HPO88047.1 tryptophan-rich sensory protein [Methanothrix sp.]
MRDRIILLVLCITICQLAGVVGSYFTDISVTTWYPTLVKPSYTPPGWFIGLVWVVLYTLMGISLFLILDSRPESGALKSALVPFGVQLLLNISWSGAFFGLRSPLYALVVIAALWLSITATMKRFFEISRKAGVLLIPYILWVSFAAFLNYTIWRLN